MGKYDTETIGDTDFWRNRLLANIVNELAEANRLKRWELERTVDVEDVSKFQEIVKELEDQA